MLQKNDMLLPDIWLRQGDYQMSLGGLLSQIYAILLT